MSVRTSLLVVGGLAIFALPLVAGFVEPSRAIKRACDIDARRLCPREYAIKDLSGLRSCMYRNKAFVGSRCGAAWMREHSGDTGETSNK